MPRSIISSSDTTDQEKIQVLIVDDIPETRENLRKLLLFESDIKVIGLAANGEEGIKMAVELQPDIVLMDINMPGIDGITASEQIFQRISSCQIIMISVQSEINYLRRSMQAGAREFLDKACLSGDGLAQSIRRIHELPRPQLPEPPPPPKATGKIVSVFSAKGGVGCSTIAVNLAIALQQEAAGKVAVVDTSLQFGDIALLLNLYPSRTIADLASAAEEPDDELIKEIFIPHASGVKALLAPPRPELADTVTPTLVHDVLEQLRSMFDIIIVDTGHVVDGVVLKVLDISDRVIVVTTPHISAIKNIKLFFDVAEALNYDPKRMIFVLNKADKRIKIRNKDIEANINHPIKSQLPLDERVPITAESGGVPYVLGSHK